MFATWTFYLKHQNKTTQTRFSCIQLHWWDTEPWWSLRSVPTVIPIQHMKHFLCSTSWHKFFCNMMQCWDLQRKLHYIPLKWSLFGSGVRRPARAPSKFWKYMEIRLCLLLAFQNKWRIKSECCVLDMHIALRSLQHQFAQGTGCCDTTASMTGAHPSQGLTKTLTAACSQSQLLHFEPFTWYCLFSWGKYNFLYLRDICRMQTYGSNFALSFLT